MSQQELEQFLSSELAENPMFEVVQADLDIGRTPTSRTISQSAKDVLPAVESLIGTILRQLNASSASKDKIATAVFLAGQLNERGFLDRDLGEIAEAEAMELIALENGLALLQSLEPAGVGARNPTECISLQLKSEGLWGSVHKALLANPEHALKDVSALTSELGVQAATVTSALEDIRNQNPDFADQFTDLSRDYITPDITFEVGPDNSVIITLNPSSFPKLRLRQLDLQKTIGDTEAAREFLDERTNHLTWLTRTLEKRETALHRIAVYVAEHQSEYFLQGPFSLKPLTMKQVADSLNLHESTVSRAVSGKYAYSPQGAVPLKYFFSRGIPQSDKSALSGAMIRFRIGQIIESESPANILSDTKICEILASEGITVARRTIAKYRESMNIPKSSIRRVQKRSKLRF